MPLALLREFRNLGLRNTAVVGGRARTDVHEPVLEGLPAEAVSLVEIPALAISSTDCRRRRERGEPVWYLVPDGVVQYLTKHDLYPASAGLPGAP